MSAETAKAYRRRYGSDIGRIVVAIGCVYELAALWSPLPTITELVHRGRHHSVHRWRVVAWAFIGLSVMHFLGLV